MHLQGGTVQGNVDGLLGHRNVGTFTGHGSGQRRRSQAKAAGRKSTRGAGTCVEDMNTRQPISNWVTEIYI